ncbi:MAG: family transcriptional regulator, cyclic receptor protein [Actinomycetota bacterium]|nr:family transcriptional regulator, cyclic receptor protein [Actinomycetota bacterium]
MAGYDRSLYQTYLSNIPMFRSCSAEQLDRLAELGEAVSASDAPVVNEGDAGDDFFVITSGKARVTRSGREVAELGPGDYFGELSLFDPSPRNATVAAIGSMSLVSLSRDAFIRALDEMPQLRDALLHGMANRIHELDARV